MITTPQIEVTHSDGDGNILVTVQERSLVLVLSKAEAMTLMANLAISISNEYGKFNSYSYPGCKVSQ